MHIGFWQLCSKQQTCFVCSPDMHWPPAQNRLTVVTETHRAHGRNGAFCTIPHGGSPGVGWGSNEGHTGVKQVSLGVVFPSAQGSESFILCGGIP